MNILAAPVKLPVQPFSEELLRGHVRYKLFERMQGRRGLQLVLQSWPQIFSGSGEMEPLAADLAVGLEDRYSFSSAASHSTAIELGRCC